MIFVVDFSTIISKVLCTLVVSHLAAVGIVQAIHFKDFLEDLDKSALRVCSHLLTKFLYENHNFMYSKATFNIKILVVWPLFLLNEKFLFCCQHQQSRQATSLLDFLYNCWKRKTILSTLPHFVRTFFPHYGLSSFLLVSFSSARHLIKA